MVQWLSVLFHDHKLHAPIIYEGSNCRGLTNLDLHMHGTLCEATRQPLRRQGQGDGQGHELSPNPDQLRRSVSGKRQSVNQALTAESLIGPLRSGANAAVPSFMRRPVICRCSSGHRRRVLVFPVEL